VNQESVKAARAQSAMVVTIGSAVPSKNRLTRAMIAAPVSICRVPASADAIPAIGPCSSSPSTIVDGMTRPNHAKARKSSVIRTPRLALLWQIVADNSGDGIPKSVFQ
jgi:hypothetical protein